MNRHPLGASVAGALVLALIVLLGLKHCGHPRRPVPAPRPPAPIPIPEPEPSPPAPRETRVPAPGREGLDRERLRPWLERLGRARLLRDRQGLERLQAEFPQVFEGDLDWIIAQLAADLFTAAGAAELIRWYGLSRALPGLAETLGHPVHPFLKDVVIETLAGLGGQAAANALAAALRSDADPGVRARAAAALGRFEHLEAYTGLAAALRDPNAAVRSAAAESMGRLGSREAVEILLRSMESEDDPEVQADLASSAYAAGGPAWLTAVQRAVAARPAAAAVLEARTRARGDARYRRPYDRAFFEPGQPEVPWDPSRRRIGITIEAGGGVTLDQAAGAIFVAAPLDRYRLWFILRRAEEFPSPRAYDARGEPIGDVPHSELDGTVYLRFKDPGSFAPGVLGYTEGREAFVTPVSLLHELGHALGRLADEYAGGSAEERPNLARGSTAPWHPLVDAGFLPPPVRRDERSLVSSGDCHMGNRPTDSRFCPVCQLEIHARIADLAGAPLPW